MIIEKQPLPDDPTPSEAPPSYDTVDANPNHIPFRDTKRPEPITPPILTPTHGYPPSSTSPSSVVKSPSSSSNFKGKGRANNSWFNFSASRTTREVQSTVLGLVRDLVREQHSNSSAALGILESCAEACAGYDLSLSTLLQEKSIENHTPLYWAIVKRPPDGDEDETAIPDLLTALVSFASPLTSQTISDVGHACLLTSDQLLFQRLRMSPEFSPLSGTDEMLLGASIPPDEITVEDKRMLVSKRIELDFIARARMWRLAFSIAQENQIHGPRQGSWCITLSLLENSPPTWIDSRLIVSEPALDSSASPRLAVSPSLLDKARGRPPPKATIVIRLKSPQQLVAPPIARRSHKQITSIVASLEDSVLGSSLQYAGTSYIAPDEKLRVRLEARLGRSSVPETECIIC
ncbi:hypothetical protein Hypma_012160 [Hypsizygus marmoreus]|uniref:Uncharacterized protein n=1 Tax=Hypsizygus marmoreus TaxID=39966 RepID=A0A369JHD2_HYPMA|nr:hypothetical protein Hypma_012160 [Hypsizygus marmoreus]